MDIDVFERKTVKYTTIRISENLNKLLRGKLQGPDDTLEDLIRDVMGLPERPLTEKRHGRPKKIFLDGSGINTTTPPDYVPTYPELTSADKNAT